MNNLGKDEAVAWQLDRKLFVKVARHNDRRLTWQVTSLLQSRIHRRTLMLNWLLTFSPASSPQTVLLKFRAGPPSSCKSPWKLQHRHTQRSVSQVILNSVQLTMKINRNGPQRRGKWLVARVSILTYLSAIFYNKIRHIIAIVTLVLCYKDLLCLMLEN